MMEDAHTNESMFVFPNARKVYKIIWQIRHTLWRDLKRFKTAEKHENKDGKLSINCVGI